MKKILIAAILTGILMTGTSVLFADDTGFTSFADTAGNSALSWSGTGLVNTRYMIDYDHPGTSPIVLYPELNFDLSYKGETSGFTGSFTLSGNYNFTNAGDISRYLSNLIDEAYYSTSLNGFDLQAGFMKIVWGKGDEIFTFDNINPVDYSDFMNGSYLNRKRAEAMVKINIPFGQQGLIEALYTPVFTPDTFPATGYWVQNDYISLANMLAVIGKTPEEALSTENMKTLSHGQGGLHITDSFGGFDIGAAYEYTFLREPVINPVDIQKYLSGFIPVINVTYDRLHLFGVEAATAFGGFNFRAEGAYYLTKDTKGTDPLIHNNKIQYLLGFDKDLPIHNMSINIQARGEVKLGSDKIKSNGQSDIEYSLNNTYSSTIIAADLRDTFLNDNLTLKVTGAYSLGGKDYMIKPGFKYNLTDDASLKADYTIYRGDSNTIFGQFKNNDMLEVICQYSF